MVIFNLFHYFRRLFYSNICRERIFSFVFYNSIGNSIYLELVFNKIYCREETITIRSGPVKKCIFIRDIKQISNTKNPIAAHALSFDRLEIVYGVHKTEIISPKDKEQFINLVKSKNPHIEIK